MQQSNEIEFKSLLTVHEYKKLMEKLKSKHMDLQTNHYFDTARFSLKALDASLHVRERDTFELKLKKKKGYTMQEYTLPIDEEVFKSIKETGVIPEGEIKNELLPIIGEQKLNNFLSFTTQRMISHYKNGVILLDKNEYLGITDYELQYESRNYQEGKQEFIQLINEFQIQYKKSEKKVKRAFNAYKQSH